MIFLDAASFMEEAIASVFAQTYGSWELLLVDDGSSDASTHVARRHAEQAPERVRYLEHPDHQNRGMSASRNVGIACARGEYIAFLDADDVYLPQKLEKQVAILDHERAAAMVYGATEHWFSWSGRREDEGRDRRSTLGIVPNSLVEPPLLAQRFLGHAAWPPATCGALIRRDAMVDVGGFEEQFRGLFEDQAFFYKLCLKHPVFVEDGAWARYRQHAASCCEASVRAGEYRRGRRLSPARKRLLDWLEAYLESRAIAAPELHEQLQRELWPYRHPLLYRARRLARLARNRVTRWRGIPAHGSGQPRT